MPDALKSADALLATTSFTAIAQRDLKRRMTLRRIEEATEICKGIIIGLYRAEQRGFELLEYAEDCPSELAGRAVDIRLATAPAAKQTSTQLHREIRAGMGLAQSLTGDGRRKSDFLQTASRVLCTGLEISFHRHVLRTMCALQPPRVQ